MSEFKTGAQRQAARLTAKAAMIGEITQSPPSRQQRRQKPRKPRKPDTVSRYVRPRPAASHILADFVVGRVNYMLHATKGWRRKTVEA